jgi:hypothetical protein
VTDPLHPLFADLARARLLHFGFTRGAEPADDRVELTLATPAGARRFQFAGVRELRLQSPFPDIGWLQVFDVRARGLERFGVEVSDGEQSEALHFLAAEVVELPSLAS